MEPSSNQNPLTPPVPNLKSKKERFSAPHKTISNSNIFCQNFWEVISFSVSGEGNRLKIDLVAHVRAYVRYIDTFYFYCIERTIFYELLQILRDRLKYFRNILCWLVFGKSSSSLARFALFWAEISTTYIDRLYHWYRRMHRSTLGPARQWQKLSRNCRVNLKPKIVSLHHNQHDATKKKREWGGKISISKQQMNRLNYLQLNEQHCSAYTKDSFRKENCKHWLKHIRISRYDSRNKCCFVEFHFAERFIWFATELFCVRMEINEFAELSIQLASMLFEKAYRNCWPDHKLWHPHRHSNMQKSRHSLDLPIGCIMDGFWCWIFHSWIDLLMRKTTIIWKRFEGVVTHLR